VASQRATQAAHNHGLSGMRCRTLPPGFEAPLVYSLKIIRKMSSCGTFPSPFGATLPCPETLLGCGKAKSKGIISQEAYHPEPHDRRAVKFPVDHQTNKPDFQESCEKGLLHREGYGRPGCNALNRVRFRGCGAGLEFLEERARGLPFGRRRRHRR